MWFFFSPLKHPCVNVFIFSCCLKSSVTFTYLSKQFLMFYDESPIDGCIIFYYWCLKCDIFCLNIDLKHIVMFLIVPLKMRLLDIYLLLPSEQSPTCDILKVQGLHSISDTLADLKIMGQFWPLSQIWSMFVGSHLQGEPRGLPLCLQVLSLLVYRWSSALGHNYKFSRNL